MNIVYNTTTGVIKGVGVYSQGVTLSGTLPDDFAKYFGLGKYLARPLTDGTAEVYLNTSWIAPSIPGTVIGANVGRTLYVDQVNGNDATAQSGSAAYPFLTLTSAKIAAQSGDLVVVQPGVYAERDILKDGVNWHFNTATLTATAGAIIDNSSSGCNVDVSCVISGNLNLINTGTSASDLAIKLPRSGSNISITVHSITTQALAVSMAAGTVHAQSITSATQGIALTGNASCTCRRTTAPIVFSIADTARFDSADMIATGTDYAGSIGAGTGIPYLRGRLSAAAVTSCFNIGTGASYGADLITDKTLDSAAETALSYGQVQII